MPPHNPPYYYGGGGGMPTTGVAHPPGPPPIRAPAPSTSSSQSHFPNPQNNNNTYNQLLILDGRDRPTGSAAGPLPRTSSLLPPATLPSQNPNLNLSKPLPSPHGARPVSPNLNPRRVETAARNDHPHQPPQQQGRTLQLGHLSPFDLPESHRASSHYVNRWSASTNSSHGHSASLSRSPPARERTSRRSSSVDITFLLAGSPPSASFDPRNSRRSRTPNESREFLASLGAGSSYPSNGRRDKSRTPSAEATNPLRQPGAREPQRYPSHDRFQPLEGQNGHQPSSAQAGDLAHSPSRPGPAATSESVAMQYEPEQDNRNGYGHTRNRSGKSSNESARLRGDKPPSQKAMLSRALQKANAAVKLDNAQNFTGARSAYTEACHLLEQVLQRTTAQDDQRKLEAIRRTYTSRIEELDQMLPFQTIEDQQRLDAARRAYASPIEELDQVHSFQTKELPAFPDDNSLRRQSVSRHRLGAPHEEEDVPIVETATMTRIIREEDQDMQYHQPPAVSHRWQPEGVPRLISPPDALPPTQQSEPGFLQSSFSKSPIRSRFPNGAMQTPPESSYGSSHLAPIATQPSPYSHGEDEDFNGPIRSDFSISPDSRPAPRRGLEHHREDSQNSWLDPIDESGGSTASSVHSRTSSLGYRRRHIRAGSGDTEHEFDNALDAAIEAAYDDGFEPMEADDFDRGHPDEEIVANALRRVEMAREMVRQTEREAYEVANERERNQLQLQRHHQQQLQQQQAQQTHQQQQVTVPPTGSRRAEDFFDDNSSEDEAEQMLEEMRNYTIQDYSQHGSGQQQKHQNPPRQGSVPRESDSSGLTRSTWNSSTGSNAFTSTTTLSTVTESAPIPTMPQGPAPAPPPTSALPDLPPPRPSSAQKTVRTRRLSSQNPKQLKIETQRINPPTTNKSAEDSAHPKSTVNGREPQSSVEPPKSTIATSRRPASPLAEAVSPTDLRPLGSPFGHRSTPDVDESVGRSASPSVTKLKKNFSSSSLKSLKGRAMSVSNMDDGDMSPGTPSSAHFSSARPPAVPAIPTPLAATLRERADTATGGMYLLDADFQSPVSATSHNYAFSDAPVSLEPCPTDSMLRPFWLMRCLYQTLAHPRGGYVSTKLFVPRDAWRVKGVKLKNIDEKIFNCDFLTAAISKLAKVDTCDADAMLEEMQSLEGNLEQVQAALSRKLGNEVGVQGAGVLFKDAATPVDGDSSVPRSTSVSNKSSFSWRRLRSKNSAAALGAPATARAGAEASKDTLSTLPMTAQPTSRPPKRDIANTHFEGPNSNYMASLARLFDAAQVIDQIARQVDDPGLRHADKTQVGLELCTRHAAEFFAFYICRFVLSDLGLLMDKFIKRGTEWVLT